MPRFKVGQPGGISVEVYIPEELYTQVVDVKQYPFNQPLPEAELQRIITLLYTNLGLALEGTFQRPHTVHVSIDKILQHITYAGMKIIDINKRQTGSGE